MSRNTARPAGTVVTHDNGTETVVNADGTTTDRVTTVTDTPTTDTYVFNIDTVVDAYVNGWVPLTRARANVAAHMTACVNASDWAGAANAATVTAALDDAAVTRRTPSRVFDVAPYVAATVARVVAMTDAAASLASGDVVPSDIPDAHRDTFVTAVRDAFSGIGTADADGPDMSRSSGTDAVRATDGYNGARANADGYAANRVVGNASVERHLADIAAGRATDRSGRVVNVTRGMFATFNTVAVMVTPEYPATVSPRPNGAVAARFRRDGVVRADADGAPVNVAGFVYATHNGTHGVRFVGTTDATVTTDTDA